METRGERLIATTYHTPHSLALFRKAHTHAIQSKNGLNTQKISFISIISSFLLLYSFALASGTILFARSASQCRWLHSLSWVDLTWFYVLHSTLVVSFFNYLIPNTSDGVFAFHSTTNSIRCDITVQFAIPRVKILHLQYFLFNGPSTYPLVHCIRLFDGAFHTCMFMCMYIFFFSSVEMQFSFYKHFSSFEKLFWETFLSSHFRCTTFYL